MFLAKNTAMLLTPDLPVVVAADGPTDSSLFVKLPDGTFYLAQLEDLWHPTEAGTPEND